MLKLLAAIFIFLIGVITEGKLQAQDSLQNNSISYSMMIPGGWMKTDSTENMTAYSDSTGIFNLRVRLIERYDEFSAFAQLLEIDSMYRETGFYSDLATEELSAINDSAFLAAKNADEISATNYYHKNNPEMIQAVIVLRKNKFYFILNYRFPYSQTETADDYFSVLFRTFRINDL